MLCIFCELYSIWQKGYYRDFTRSWTWRWSWQGQMTPLEQCTCGPARLWTLWVQRKTLEGRHSESVTSVTGGPCRPVHRQVQTQCFNATLPGRCTCLAPQTRVAPSLIPVWQYSNSLSRWALWFWGPWSVERSSGSPIFIFLTSSTWEKRRRQTRCGLRNLSQVHMPWILGSIITTWRVLDHSLGEK